MTKVRVNTLWKANARGSVLRREVINLNPGVIVPVSFLFEFWWRKNYF
jgi:hypothetical protein